MDEGMFKHAETDDLRGSPLCIKKEWGRVTFILFWINI